MGIVCIPAHESLFLRENGIGGFKLRPRKQQSDVQRGEEGSCDPCGNWLGLLAFSCAERKSCMV